MKILRENERRHFYRPIDIAYKPVPKINRIINCYFSKSMWNAYCVVNHKKGRAEPSTADQCYAFNRFFTEQKSLERHLNCCAHIPRVVYRFENQSIQTFFDDTKFMLICRLPSILILKPLVIKKPTILTMMQAYTLFCTPLWLNLDRTFVVRSFNHTFEQLNDVSCPILIP